SIPWLEHYWRYELGLFFTGKTAEEASVFIQANPDWGFLSHKVPLIRLAGEKASANFSRATKTGAIWRSALPGAPRCEICHGLWHRNSIHIDHEVDKSRGGSGRPENARVTHPYCDSTYKYVA